jgi:hypothetical protein
MTDVKKYHFTNGYTMEREYGTAAPNGCVNHGSWVLRDKDGLYIDRSANRNDVIERNNIDVEREEK